MRQFDRVLLAIAALGVALDGDGADRAPKAEKALKAPKPRVKLGCVRGLFWLAILLLIGAIIGAFA